MSAKFQPLQKTFSLIVILIVLLACSSTSNTSTTEPTQVPTSAPVEIGRLADFASICDDLKAKKQQVYAVGKISMADKMSTCSVSYCRVDFSKNSETISVWIATNGTANKMDELPDWYSAEDFKVYDINGQLVNLDDPVKVTFNLWMMPSKFYGTDEVCSLAIKTIELVSDNSGGG